MKMPRSEYPNPQFQRRDWINLNGEWDFEIDNSSSGLEREVYKNPNFKDKILVPFCPESELSGIGHTDFILSCWYKRSFTVPDNWKNGKTHLHFGAVDYEAIVFVNGEKVGTHKGGYVHFSFNITKYLVDGENTLVLLANDDLRSGKQSAGKQSGKYNSWGCYYTRTTGVWQTVWLEYTPDTYIKSVKYFPDTENCSLHILAEVVGSGEFSAKAFYEGEEMGEAKVYTHGNTVNLHLPLAEKHLWEVGHGRLYNLTLTFASDTVSSYFGLRTVAMDGMKFLLNGKTVFQRLVLDQGFYPDGIYTAKNAKELHDDVLISKAMGFNGARLHEKIFEPLFLYYCDKEGYMVWGEHANWGIDHSEFESIPNFIPEWIEAVKRDFNHPSIVGWCPLNEVWDKNYKSPQFSLMEMAYLATKAFDPTRPCIDSSGGFHVATDIYDLHNYEQDPDIFYETYKPFHDKMELVNTFPDRQKYEGQPVFISEYGGIAWDTKSDSEKNWGYGTAPKTPEEFIDRYKRLTDALLDNKNFFGFCYTQLYDVEQEINGLYTYDRKPKFDPNVIAKITSRKAAIED